MRRLALLTLILPVIAACTTQIGSSCDLMAASSVSLELRAPDGTIITNATARWSTFDAEGDCELLGERFACGWEVPGEMSIAIDAPRYMPTTVSASIVQDECHVLTEMLTVELEPELITCPEEIEPVPGVIVHVIDTQGAEVSGGSVTWGLANADMAPVPCSSMGGAEWACAEEQSGLIDIFITDAGPYEPYYSMVTVDHDGCHPIPERLDAVLSYLPD